MVNGRRRDNGELPFTFLKRDWGGRGAGRLLLALALLFHLDKLLLGPWAVIRLHDVFDSDYFRYGEMGRLLLQHGPFTWFPNFQGGMPAYAWHHTPFFILSVLASFLPAWFLYHSIVIGLMAAAGWGMFRLLRENLDLPPRSALLGGAFFALISQIQPNCIPETIFNYAFPLFYVWAMQAWENRGERRRAAGPLAGVVLIFLLSYPVLTLPYFAVLHLAVLGFDKKLAGRRAAAAFWTFVLWSGYALCCLPVLYSLWSFAPQAARHFEASSLPGAASILDLVCNLGRNFLTTSASTLTFVPLLAALPLVWRAPRLRRAFGLWAALLFSAALFSSTVARLWAGTMIGKMDLGHFSWTVPFCAVLALALAADEFFRHPHRAGAFWAACCSALLLLAGLTWMGFATRETLALNVVVAAALTSVCFVRAPTARVAAIILAILCVRVYRTMGDEPERNPYRTTLEDRSFLKTLRDQDAEPWRAGVVSGFPQEALRGYGLETIDGRGPIINGRYKDFFRLIVAPQLADRKRAEFFDWYWYNLYLNLAGDDRQAQMNLSLLALANVRYLVSAHPLPELAAAATKIYVEKRDSAAWLSIWNDRLSRIWPLFGRFLGRAYRNHDYVVYELRDTFPRGFLADRAELLTKDSDVLAALSKSPVKALRSTVFFSAQDTKFATVSPWLAQKGSSHGNTSRLIVYTPDRLEFQLNLARPSILVVTNNYHHYWRARIDGGEAAVYRADHTFQAVLLPRSGEHRVVLEFRDPFLAATHGGIALGALFILLPILMGGRRNPVVSGVS